MTANLDQTKEDFQRTVREIVRVVLYRRWAFLIPFCICATAVFIYSHRLPREYRAETIFQRSNTIPISKVLATRGPESIARVQETMVNDIAGEDSMVKVVDELIADKVLTPVLPRREDGSLTEAGLKMRRALARSLGNKISVHRLTTSPHLDKIRISAKGDEPELLVHLVEEARDNYFEFGLERWLNELRKARRFYEGEIEAKYNEIQQQELEVEKLVRAYPYVTDTQYYALNHKDMTIDMDRDRFERQIEDTTRKIRRLEERLATMPQKRLLPEPDGKVDAEFLNTEAELQAEGRRIRKQILNYKAEMEKLRIERGMKDAHPMMQKLIRLEDQARAKLAAVTEKLANITPDGVDLEFSENPAEVALDQAARQNLLNELAEAQAALTLSQERLNEANRRLETHERIRNESLKMRPRYRELKQSMEVQRTELDELRSEEFKLARVLDMDAKDQGIEFATISEAGTTRRPVSPNPRSIVVLALGVGLTFGAGCVFLREFFDHTFHTANAVSFSLGLQVLEGIDEILLPEDRRRRLLKRLVTVPVACVLLAVLTVAGGLAYLSLDNPQQYKRVVDQANAVLDRVDILG